MGFKVILPNKSYRVFLCVIFIIFFSNLCSANIGGAVLWAQLFHCIIGNFIIGILEIFVFKIIAKAVGFKQIFLLMIANYTSFFIGLFLLTKVNTANITINTANTYIIRTIFLSYLATVFCEAPFVYLSLQKQERRVWRSLSVSAILQTASYLVLIIPFYFLLSSFSTFRELEVVSKDELKIPTNLVIYYLADETGEICKVSFGNENRTDCSSSIIFGKKDRIVLIGNDKKLGHFDLYLFRSDNHNSWQSEGEIVESNVGMTGVPSIIVGVQNPIQKISSEVAYLGEKDSTWVFSGADDAFSGLYGKNNQTGKEIYIDYRTPVLSWFIDEILFIPTDLLIFRLGKKQICMLDLQKRKMTLIAFGRSPVAVISNAR